MDKVSRPSREELLTWKVKKHDNWDTQYIRPEQKPEDLMQELICRLTRPGDTVVDLYVVTFATAMACFSLPRHRKFIGCNLDGACVSHAKHHVLFEIASVV